MKRYKIVFNGKVNGTHQPLDAFIDAASAPPENDPDVIRAAITELSRTFNGESKKVTLEVEITAVLPVP